MDLCILKKDYKPVALVSPPLFMKAVTEQRHYVVITCYCSTDYSGILVINAAVPSWTSMLFQLFFTVEAWGIYFVCVCVCV